MISQQVNIVIKKLSPSFVQFYMPHIKKLLGIMKKFEIWNPYLYGEGHELYI